MKNALEQFEHYIAYERRLAPGTVHNYIRDCEEFVTWCHSTPQEFRPALVSREDFSGWINHLTKDNKCKAASVNTKSSSVKAWFRWMADKEIIDHNPLAETYRLKTPAKLPTYIHTDNIQNIARTLLARLEEAEEYAPKRDALL
ncbi:MAG: phage integrase N-terminal SAM-like domain-containing protein, partial [Tidjanibacter sp.]|nr:phage integrase N-terminal SAM-like domain-containing protein [Tidjanibacter sp.]